MIKSLKMVNSYGDDLVVDLRNPEVSGYAITGMNGLGPVDVDIKQTQMVSGLKYKYNKGFHKYRDITIQFIFYEFNNNHLSIDTLRRDLIKILKTDDLVTLYFVKDNDQVRKIQGYVSKHDAAYFSNACGAQVTITCPDPWFIKVNADDTAQDKYYMLFGGMNQDNSKMQATFEVSEGFDEDLTEVDIPYVEGSTEYSVTIPYDGSIVSGMKIKFTDDIMQTRGVEFEISSEHYRLGKTGSLSLKEPNNYYPEWIDGDEWDPYYSTVKRITKSAANQEGYTDSNHEVYFWSYENPDTKVYIYEDPTSNYILASRVESPTYVRDESEDPLYLWSPSSPDYTFTVTIEPSGRLVYVHNDYTASKFKGGKDGVNKDIYFNSTPCSNRYLEIDTGYDYLSVMARSRDNEEVGNNIIGWVDYASITKRQNLPALYQGNNTVKIKTSSALNNPIVAKVYFRTLYREV